MADVGTGQADRAALAAAGGGEPAGEEHAPVHLQAAGGQGGPGVVTQLRPAAVKVMADVGTGQADRAALAAAGGGELAAEDQGLAHLQAVGGQGGPGVVTQLRAGAVKLAADVGTGQVNRAALAAAGDPCLGQVEETAGEMCGI
jgi:hypothetical protein